MLRMTGYTPATATLTGVVRDFTPDHPDFQHYLTGPVPGLVAPELGDDGNPVFVGRSGDAVTSADSFNQWYTDTPGVNLATEVSLPLTETAPGSGVYQFLNPAFFPIDGQLFGSYEYDHYAHNFHFTLRLETRFTYHGGEVLNFSSDDDLWLFVDGRLAVDIGGTHGGEPGSVSLDDLGLVRGGTYSYVLFFAERFVGGSSLLFQMPTPAEGADLRYAYQVRSVDPDPTDALTYSLVTRPPGMSVNPATGLITWTPADANLAVPQSVTVRVDDGRGGADEQSFVVTTAGAGSPTLPLPVADPGPGDDPPVFLDAGPSAAAVDAGGRLRYAAVVSDPEGDPVTFDLPSAPGGMAVHPTLGVVVWTPKADQIGTFSAVLRARDDHGNVALLPFAVTVAEPNTPPTFGPFVPGGSVPVGSPYTFQVQARDADGDAVTFRLEGAPAGMTIDTAGLVTWTPSAADVGFRSFTIVASDVRGGESRLPGFVSVGRGEPNRDPLLLTLPATAATPGRAYGYAVHAFDLDGDRLTYSLSVKPDGMTIDPDTGVITWLPTPDQVGDRPVAVVVSDGRGGTATQPFTVAVAGRVGNAAHVVTSAPRTTATVGRTYFYPLFAADPDGDPVAGELVTAPRGMSIDPEGGFIFWTPAPDQLGPQEVAVRVSDATGAGTTQSFTVSSHGLVGPRRGRA